MTNSGKHATPPAPAAGATAFQRLAAGEAGEECFEAALPQLARLVRGYVVRFGARRDLVEDLAQEAIIRIYTRRCDRRGRGVASLKAWIRVICRNLTITAGQRKPLPPPRTSTETPVSRWDLREALDLGIERLREPDRSVFRLRYEHDWPTGEIAELYGWKIRNAEHVLARARGSLARWLRREGYGG